MRPALDELHSEVERVLNGVRGLAGELHPSSLAHLGLVPALEALARDHGREIVVLSGALPDPLPEPLRTGVYRLVEHTSPPRSPGRSRR